ncbi:TRIM71 [Mytilus edulis]|uniref:TRIM71 n=1 Tax=Mytilus edulis TaxID=6550 RepID=A0A8S3U1V6_MYTED|nr:TRIM71 [Mytilus edulis]
MAQNLMVCQFCETSNEPKYKCVNCDLILCEGCKIKIHTKIKKTEVHQVLDLKEFSNLGASETIRHLDLKDIHCSIHNAEHCIIYCEDCKVLLCAFCLLESHQTHTLAKIAEVYHKKVKELQELENKIHQELPFYVDLEKELKQTKSVENDQYNEIKQRILKKESELTEIITKQRENLITELDKLWKPREDDISKHLSDTAEKCDALTRKKAQIEETFQSHNATAIFTASGKLDKDLPTRPVNTISEQKLLFSETRILGDRTEVFGSILIIPTCKITRTFTTDPNAALYRIQTYDNFKYIFCDLKQTNLKSFELKDSECITASIANENKLNIIDMTILTKANSNSLLFTVAASSEIKCLSNFTSEGKELKQTKSVENDKYNEIKQRILKKESELIENITKQRDNLITELDKLWKPREDEMSRQLTDTAEKCDALARNKIQIEETFQSHNATAILTASGKLDKDLPTRPVNTISEQKLLFSETRNLEDTKEVFGSVLIGPECKITGSFTLDN